MNASRREVPLVRRVYAHASGGDGWIRVRGKPPKDWPEFVVEDEARQIQEFLFQLLPARLYAALAKRMHA